ncbi:MAG: RNA-binding domain-containing protein [Candidatus Latescibacterota bacterium]
MRHTLRALRALLVQLDGAPADAIESETVECKPWHPEPSRRKEQVRDLCETVVCLANHRGGVILLGVQDRQRTRQAALVGVGDLQPDGLRRAIYDGTDPHILVDVEELSEPEGRLLVIHVPPGLGAHTTSEGVAKIRVGKDCQPLTGSMLAQRMATAGESDRTALPCAGAVLGDLDPDPLGRLQGLVATEGRKPELGRLEAVPFLEHLGLVRQGEVTLAAVLLVGRSAALARCAPLHELVFLRYATPTRYDVRHNLKGPILEVLERTRQLLEAHLQVAELGGGGFAEVTAPDITWWTAREAVLNALVHRDYFLRQSVYVELRPGSLEVSSPGGFIGGVTPENILRHPPRRRNPLLADVLEAAGLVNRAALGVDRIYDDLLRLGKQLPRYEADEATVRLRLPTRSHPDFARFVAQETREGRRLELDDLILLRAAADRGQLDRWSAAGYLQASEDDAAARLASLRQRGYLVPRGRGRGTSYFLCRSHSELLRGRLATDDGLALDDEAVRLRVEAVLLDRGQLTNAEVRRLSGYTRVGVVRLMQRLRREGVVELRGAGRAAHYVPGPALSTRGTRPADAGRSTRK